VLAGPMVPAGAEITEGLSAVQGVQANEGGRKRSYRHPVDTKNVQQALSP
jgi:hypothetical protein